MYENTCKRSNGTERAWFLTRAEAEAFAEDPENPAYHGDIAHLCPKCGFWHLSKVSWLFPENCGRCGGPTEIHLIDCSLEFGPERERRYCPGCVPLDPNLRRFVVDRRQRYSLEERLRDLIRPKWVM